MTCWPSPPSPIATRPARRPRAPRPRWTPAPNARPFTPSSSASRPRRTRSWPCSDHATSSSGRRTPSDCAPTVSADCSVRSVPPGRLQPAAGPGSHHARSCRVAARVPARHVVVRERRKCRGRAGGRISSAAGGSTVAGRGCVGSAGSTGRRWRSRGCGGRECEAGSGRWFRWLRHNRCTCTRTDRRQHVQSARTNRTVDRSRSPANATASPCFPRTRPVFRS